MVTYLAEMIVMRYQMFTSSASGYAVCIAMLCLTGSTILSKILSKYCSVYCPVLLPLSCLLVFYL